jgi:hypothetical protein
LIFISIYNNSHAKSLRKSAIVRTDFFEIQHKGNVGRTFPLPHRDGEKLDRMVATLIIVLPSVHAGGELILYHDGWQYEIPFPGAASGYELSYAAFYADCQHEVQPLQSGYRLCLTYNVTLAKSRS